MPVVLLSAAFSGTSLPVLIVAFSILVRRRSPGPSWAPSPPPSRATPQAFSLALGSSWWS